jgi:arylsulfatase A-like enzyme
VRRRLGVVVAALALAGLGGCRQTGDPPLPTAITVEQLVLDVTATYSPERVTTTGATQPVRLATLTPGEPLRGHGPRTAIVTPPGTNLQFTVAAPADAVLRFAPGIDGVKDRAAQPDVRFEVWVDGARAWQQVANPGRSRHERRWFEGRIALGATPASHTVELRTLADGPADSVGIPGWSRVRVVEETRVARQPARAEGPNLLVLVIDTCRADRLGLYGADPSPSPTLDAFAREGLVFRRAVAQASWTLPSVASIMTGLHPHSHGALNDRPDRTGVLAGEYLSDRLDTWAERAARAGISTMGASANVLVSHATNLVQGFERFSEFGWDPVTKQWASADELNAVFLRWYDAHPDLRFAAYLHYMEPHDPYDPPADLRPAVPAGVRPAVASGWIRDIANRVNWSNEGHLSPDEVAYAKALYDAEIQAWDRRFATFLAALDARGLRTRTTVIVTADHGEEFQEHGHLAHGSHLYQETIAVPLVIAGPGVPRGERSDLAQGIDLAPTITQRLGLAPAAGLPGRDLLAGPQAVVAVSETVRGIAPDGSPLALVAGQDRRWKRIEAPALGRAESFDLESDPGERQDHPDSVESRALASALSEWRATAAPAPPRAGRDPGLREKLDALGYLHDD